MTVRAKHVFRWDLDKTYLRTDFDSVRGLVRAAMESAGDKQAYPGAAALLRTIRKSPDQRICIVSGSPKQMRHVLSAKLALDGVEFDELVLKNNLGNLMRLRFRAIRAQLPFKLPALLESRCEVLGQPEETLFGDDAEADAIVYSLYADILAGKVETDELTRTLEAARAYPDQIDRIVALAARVPKGDCVRQILIHLDRRSPTVRFAPFGTRVVPIYNYFQAALVLYGDGVLAPNQVAFVAREMLESNEYSPSTLANSLQDLLRRGRLASQLASRLSVELKELAAGVPNETARRAATSLATALGQRVVQLGGCAPLEWPEENPSLDYMQLVDGDYHQRRS